MGRSSRENRRDRPSSVTLCRARDLPLRANVAQSGLLVGTQTREKAWSGVSARALDEEVKLPPSIWRLLGNVEKKMRAALAFPQVDRAVLARRHAVKLIAPPVVVRASVGDQETERFEFPLRRIEAVELAG